jgi:hypothetical protein
MIVYQKTRQPEDSLKKHRNSSRLPESKRNGSRMASPLPATTTAPPMHRS